MVSIIEKPKKVKSDFFGSTGTSIYGGYFNEEYLNDLLHKEAAETYDKMRRSDCQIKMLLTAIKNPIKSAKFYHEAVDDEQKEVADFLNFCWFDNIDFNKWLVEALTFLEFGFCIHEKKFKFMDHKDFGFVHVIDALGYRSQKTIERWKVAPDTGFVGVEQMAWGDTTKRDNQNIFIPKENIILFSLDAEGDNYEGISLLRPCYGSWFRKNLNLKLIGIGNEKASIGTPIGFYPNGTTDEDKENFRDALSNFVIHEQSYLMAPEGYKIDVIKMPFEAEKILSTIQYEDTQISKSFLMQFLELGQSGNSGSYALGADQSDITLSSLQFLGDYITAKMDEVNADLVKWNFGDVVAPKAKCAGINSKAGKELADVINILITSKVITTDSELEDYVRDIYNLPQKKEEATEPEPEPALAEARMTTQSVLFDKQKFTLDSALAWINRNNLTAHKPPDVTENKIRVRQRDPNDFVATSFRIKEIAPGVEFVLGVLRPSLTEFGEIYRELTQYEQGIDFAEIEADFDSETDKLYRLMKSQLMVMAEKAMRASESLMSRNEKDRSKAIADLSINSNQYQKYLQNQMGSIVAVGSEQAKKELSNKGVKEFAESFKKDIEFLPKDVKTALMQQAKVQAESQAAEIQKIISFTVSNGVSGDIPTKALISMIEDEINKYIDSPKVKSAAGTMVSQNINRGRQGFFFDQKNLESIQAFQYSAIIDDRTTALCLSLDGKIMKTNDPDLARFRPPNHYNCRSILVPITINEEKPKITGIEIDPTNPNLVKSYKDQGKPIPSLEQIKKQKSL